uniref:Sterile alpha and TIR motif-containing protein 1 n=1 Tax=Schizaphis graminum TaxID=13262 RepID=A0A2S2PBG3_SCHGA
MQLASGLAPQPCQLIGEEVSYRLNKKVPQWPIEYVLIWFNLIGGSDFIKNVLENRVDGDLLLRITEDELRDDIGIHNGLMNKRIMRELNNLKQSADYSSIDSTGLNSVLKSINSEYSVYTYPMLKAGVNVDSIRFLTDDQLKNVCGISNGIHRSCIKDLIQKISGYTENVDKPFDAFISYRRSTSNVLASLLKVCLDIRGYKVFIDLKRSNDAKHRHDVLQTVKKSKNFIIALTQDSLDGVIEPLDMIREEVATAKQSQCNIIPVLDDFSWSTSPVPDDLKNLNMYNSISWVHDYQDACVNKLVKFMIK